MPTVSLDHRPSRVIIVLTQHCVLWGTDHYKLRYMMTALAIQSWIHSSHWQQLLCPSRSPFLSSVSHSVNLSQGSVLRPFLHSLPHISVYAQSEAIVHSVPLKTSHPTTLNSDNSHIILLGKQSTMHSAFLYFFVGNTTHSKSI